MNIGLSFSGGGYRASSFSLGSITYLNSIQFQNKALLEHVVALSTVSGGTITGARYVIGVKRREGFDKIYASLYQFMIGINLIEQGIDRLNENTGWTPPRVRTLINAFSDVYDKELFDSEKFGALMTPDNAGHLTDISFNATEFTYGLQFRFQISASGVIGNNEFRVPATAAAEIRMSDITAASSCFPGGFEPINFPSDFLYQGAPNLQKLAEIQGYPIGLMDGGVVDNQGIEPLLYAEGRMKKTPGASSISNEMDLIIVCDVASPFMDNYKASEEKPFKGWRNWTPATVLSINAVVLTCSMIGLFLSISNKITSLIVLSTSVATLSLIVFFLGRWFKSLPLGFEVPSLFLKPLGKLLRVKFGIYETMIHNRISSLLKLTGSVFLKHVRRLNYDRIYEDKSWLNRRIMSAVYELKTGAPTLESKLKNKTVPDYLKPSPEVANVATFASSMGTTLWFTLDQLDKTDQRKHMLDSLIVCGQFTMCWNLLEYIETLEKDKAGTNMTQNHHEFMKLKDLLLLDWNKFQLDPYWMINSIKPVIVVTGLLLVIG